MRNRTGDVIRARRTKHHAQWIKEFHRYIGDRVARILAPTFITPTQITIMRFLIGVLAAVLIALNNEYRTLVLAAIGLYMFSMLDAVDGSLAKIKKNGTFLGSWLDRQADGLVFFLIFLGIGLRVAKHQQYGPYLALMSMAVLAMAFLLKTTNIAIRVNPKFQEIKKSEARISNPEDHRPKVGNTSFLSILKDQVDHDFHTVSLIISVALLLNQIELMLIFLFNYLLFWWIIKTFQMSKAAYLYDKRIELDQDTRNSS